MGDLVTRVAKHLKELHNNIITLQACKSAIIYTDSHIKFKHTLGSVFNCILMPRMMALGLAYLLRS